MNQKQYNKLKEYCQLTLDVNPTEHELRGIADIFEEEIKEPSIKEDKIEYLCNVEWHKINCSPAPFRFQEGFDKGYRLAIQSLNKNNQP